MKALIHGAGALQSTMAGFINPTFAFLCPPTAMLADYERLQNLKGQYSQLHSSPIFSNESMGLACRGATYSLTQQEVTCMVHVELSPAFPEEMPLLTIKVREGLGSPF